jgi:hypothetical protein
MAVRPIKVTHMATSHYYVVEVLKSSFKYKNMTKIEIFIPTFALLVLPRGLCLNARIMV